MRIGVISDTHIAKGEVLPPQVLQALQGVSLILHCGDLDDLSVLDQLEAVAPVKAVRGYGDPYEEGERLAETVRIVQAERMRIGLIHDLWWPGPPIKIGSSWEFPSEPLEQVLIRKFGEPVDLVAYGDTHEEMVALYEGVLFINPGSPTRPGTRHERGELGTVAILEVRNRLASVEIVELG